MQEKSINFKNEKELQARTNKYFKSKGYYIYKISDTGMGYKPYDLILRTNNSDYHIEQKVLNTQNTDVFKSLRPQQRGNLDLITKLGGNGLVMVYSKKEKSILIYKYQDLQTGIDFFEFNR